MKSEKRPFKVMLEITPTVVRLLVTELEGDVVKAAFTAYPDHTRALLLILEGLALWSGHPLSVAIHAEHPVSHSLGLGSFGDDWPEESALVHFLFVDTSGDKRRRIGGVGDFGRLRQLDRYGRGL